MKTELTPKEYRELAKRCIKEGRDFESLAFEMFGYKFTEEDITKTKAAVKMFECELCRCLFHRSSQSSMEGVCQDCAEEDEWDE